MKAANSQCLGQIGVLHSKIHWKPCPKTEGCLRVLCRAFGYGKMLENAVATGESCNSKSVKLSFLCRSAAQKSAQNGLKSCMTYNKKKLDFNAAHGRAVNLRASLNGPVRY